MHRDVQAWESADPDYAAFIGDKPFIKNLLIGNTVDQMRANMAVLRPANAPPVDTQGVEVKDASAGSVPVRIYRPPKQEYKLLPVLVVYHGGGWALGDLESEHPNCILWSKEFRCVVVNVDYRLAPEHPFPAANEDCWTAFEWVLQNAKDLGVDKEKIFLFGNSAGANLASVVAQRARDQGIKLSGQFLRIPAPAHYDAVPDESTKTFAKADILDAGTMRVFWDAYLSHGEDVKDPLVSPLLGNVEGLPPTYSQIAGMDPLRDSGIAYHEKLLKAGVQSVCKVYNGVPHGFTVLPINVSKVATQDMLSHGKKLLEATGHKL